ncbi:DUF1444 domain-containing protein [Bacillus alkalicellulosilyticus]|uniref:DUF1444 domain-containing protein n=1 Tax=Alkalihalobacterium alkalicellulosilyticum TaxID=1912214 RepID=UPI000998B48C|nr:DUF1444 domain-containing protein [Bacillus alkalicellulosilyticus]
MKVTELKQLLTEKFEQADRNIVYNREEQKLRIENKLTKKGVTLSLSPLVAKYAQKKEKALEEAIQYVEKALAAMNETIRIEGNEKSIFPVIRSTSFPEETKDGKKLLFDEHTSETRIYYSIDIGDSYVLLDQSIVEASPLKKEDIKEMALFNLRALPYTLKQDTVAGNAFYFLNSKDGYDASRVLNEAFLTKMTKEISGKMAVATPHQDVLIIADIQNDTGYDVLAQMTFHFFNAGNIPITPLPFLYDNGELEPTFILAQRKPKQP